MYTVFKIGIVTTVVLYNFFSFPASKKNKVILLQRVNVDYKLLVPDTLVVYLNFRSLWLISHTMAE